jgi:alpha-1,4-digalacturonate transport system permease protein
LAKRIKKERGVEFKQKVVPYLFLAPNLLIFSIFIILPALIGFYYSFTNVTLFTFDGFDFIGLRNYVKLLNNEYFIKAFTNTIKLVIVVVPLMYVASLTLAVLIVQPIKAKGLFRAVYYWPVMISAIVVGIMWNWILAGNFSIFNAFIKAIGLESMKTLTDPTFAWWSVVFALVWSRAGYYMIIFMAALLSIPVSLYEASDIDGANKWQKFLYITYPAIRPARLMVFILTTMEIFKVYPLVVTLTGGGPHRATYFTVQYVYEVAFKEYQVGSASAMSMVMLLIVTIFTAANFFLSKRGENV